MVTQALVLSLFRVTEADEKNILVQKAHRGETSLSEDGVQSHQDAEQRDGPTGRTTTLNTLQRWNTTILKPWPGSRPRLNPDSNENKSTFFNNQITATATRREKLFCFSQMMKKQRSAFGSKQDSL